MEQHGRRETWPIRSQSFRGYLAQRFYIEDGKTPAGTAISDALTVLEGKALYEGESRRVWSRVAEDAEGNILIDLGSPKWDAIRVTPAGWDIVGFPSVYFRRTKTTGALPPPQRGASLEDLRRVINLQDERDFQRAVGWLVGAARPKPPYPVLVLVSEQGSGKSVGAKCLRSLIDPSSLPLRSMPKDERDLAIAARGNHVLLFDNVSHLPAWLSDTLCRIATGDGWATRRLYTDAEEEVFTFARAAILTGIDDFVVASDLLDRSLIVNLPAISPEDRRQEAEVLEQFALLQPSLVGALLDAIVIALQNRHRTWPRLPRMADFVAFVMNAEPALPWPPGAFLESFTDNEAAAHDVVLDAAPIADELSEFVIAQAEKTWVGTATELLKKLDERADDNTRKNRRWPKSARALSNEIRRILPTLRRIGVLVTFEREANAKRKRLVRVAGVSELPGAVLDGTNGSRVDAADDSTVDDVDETGPRLDASSGLDEAEVESGVDAVDVVDDEISPLEEWEEEI